jgi:glucoamylase
MVLKALEDKTYRGAMIASPSNPWGAGPNANEATTTGYHAVWSRDLYHVATAFLAMRDKASANRALDFLFRTQQKPDGSFPQNSRVNGRAIGSGVQMDQIAFPLILAFQLERTDADTWQNHIKPAADFLLSRGPFTEQERWEEEAGYSPSTIAAEIAGLVCAAEIANINNEARSAAIYLAKADEWVANVERWTATTNGPMADGNYYLRITRNQDPNDGEKLEINSGGGSFDEREIVDAGFLDLVRLGIRRANDPLIKRSLAIIDRLIKVETPHGPAWYRYNHDAYGEREDGNAYDGRSGRGRPWPLLTGERGQLELAQGKNRRARRRLDSMMGFANEGRMIPEQIWDLKTTPEPSLRFGEGTGSATPLAWSMAQFIRLAISLSEGHNVETPEPVMRRYTQGKR